MSDAEDEFVYIDLGQPGSTEIEPVPSDVHSRRTPNSPDPRVEPPSYKYHRDRVDGRPDEPAPSSTPIGVRFLDGLAAAGDRRSLQRRCRTLLERLLTVFHMHARDLRFQTITVDDRDRSRCSGPRSNVRRFSDERPNMDAALDLHGVRLESGAATTSSSSTASVLWLSQLRQHTLLTLPDRISQDLDGAISAN